ncbi:cyclic-phosphate processing receiver domain-containing protein [Paenibacillus sp. TAB 01]|uniref:cyclic-phosphate processing receiver domain-containing protein n=1 Tax=Paenibacillus sp. TAB 01 TaxID=3368988 RepID=UPI0037504F0F
MINVFLDDLRPRPKGYLLARSVQECIKLIRSHEVGVLSLDYNLGRGRPTGASVVGYIIKKKRYPKKIILHTADRSGRRRMYRVLKRGMPKTVNVLIRPKPTFVGSRSTG